MGKPWDPSVHASQISMFSCSDSWVIHIVIECIHQKWYSLNFHEIFQCLLYLLHAHVFFINLCVLNNFMLTKELKQQHKLWWPFHSTVIPTVNFQSVANNISIHIFIFI